MARLPLQADVVHGDFVEHHLPRGRRVGDVPARVVPPAAHVAVLEGDPHALVLGALGQVRPDLLEFRHRIRQRLALDGAGEAAHEVASEQPGVIDHDAEIHGGSLVHERIAKQSDRADDGAIADGLHHFGGRLLEVHGADLLPAGEREALKAMRENLLEVVGAFIHRRQRSDADIELRHKISPFRA